MGHIGPSVIPVPPGQSNPKFAAEGRLDIGGPATLNARTEEVSTSEWPQRSLLLKREVRVGAE